MRFWNLSHICAAKAQTRLCLCTVTPEPHAQIQRGGDTLENLKNIGFLGNTGQEPLKKSQSCQASI